MASESLSLTNNVSNMHKKIIQLNKEESFLVLPLSQILNVNHIFVKIDNHKTLKIDFHLIDGNAVEEKEVDKTSVLQVRKKKRHLKKITPDDADNERNLRDSGYFEDDMSLSNLKSRKRRRQVTDVAETDPIRCKLFSPLPQAKLNLEPEKPAKVRDSCDRIIQELARQSKVFSDDDVLQNKSEPPLLSSLVSPPRRSIEELRSMIANLRKNLDQQMDQLENVYHTIIEDKITHFRESQSKFL